MQNKQLVIVFLPLLFIILLLFFNINHWLFYFKNELLTASYYLSQIRNFNNNQTVTEVATASAKIKLLFTGDLMLDRGVAKSVANKFDNNFSLLFENIKDYLKSFDFIIVNLEGPISNRGNRIGSKYSFRMDPKVIKQLSDVNIKVFNLANNHIFDYNYQAFHDTLKNIKANNSFYFGADVNIDQASRGLILEKNGISIGFLGFTQFLKHFNAQNNKPGILFLNDDNLKKSIPQLKNKVDFLVVVFHWGEEYQNYPNNYQRNFARKAIDLGADLIIGHHPHVVQTIEKYKNKFIFYSLGNFIFDQSFSKETMKGGLVEVVLEKKNLEDIYYRWSYLNNDYQIATISDRLLPYYLINKIFLLKIATTSEDHTRGLMFVRKPVDFEGMLFIFSEKMIRNFWNKNTFLDLDVYWLDGSKVIAKDFLPALKNNKDIQTITSPLPVDRVIEIIR